jgi:hypothetical protein
MSDDFWVLVTAEYVSFDGDLITPYDRHVTNAGRACGFPARTLSTADEARPAHVSYGRNSGRAVWSPSSFEEDGERVKNSSMVLPCYHRNLVFETVRALALCGLAASTSARLAANRLRVAGRPQRN